mgnify:CR=1 FL=1
MAISCIHPYSGCRHNFPMGHCSEMVEREVTRLYLTNHWEWEIYRLHLLSEWSCICGHAADALTPLILRSQFTDAPWQPACTEHLQLTHILALNQYRTGDIDLSQLNNGVALAKLTKKLTIYHFLTSSLISIDVIRMYIKRSRLSLIAILTKIDFRPTWDSIVQLKNEPTHNCYH